MDSCDRRLCERAAGAKLFRAIALAIARGHPEAVYKRRVDDRTASSDDVDVLRARIRGLEAELARARPRVAFFDEILANVPIYVVRANADHRITFVSRTQAPLRNEDVVGGDLYDFVAPPAREAMRQAIAESRAVGKVVRYETLAPGPEGTLAAYESYVWPSADGSEIVFAALDVSELRRQSATIGERDVTLRLAAEATGLALWTFDLRTGEVVWDEAMYALCGCERPLAPEAYITIVHPDDRARVLASMEETRSTGSFASPSHRIVRPDGQVRWVFTMGRVLTDETGAPYKYIGGSLDITKDKEAESALRVAQRMEAVGQLTAGVAHNFNNMLSVMLPTLELVGRTAGERERRLIRAALEAGERASRLVANMMTLAADRSRQHKVSAPLAELVAHAVEIGQTLIGEHIEIRLDLGADEARALVDVGDIEQVVVNLLVNARDALESTPSPRIDVRLTRSGGHVEVAVGDNGPGIPLEVRDRIFEPFFTTKPPGKGTGLGLANAYAVMRDHGGSITCESDVGRGTVFTLRLPSAVHQAPGEPAPHAEPVSTAPAPAPAMVLVVDDEPHIRTILERVLADAGHHVLLAECASAALAVVAREPRVRVALVDQGMPGGVTPRDLDGLRAGAPGLRVVLHTGNDALPELAAIADLVLTKPVSIPVMLATIEQLIADTRK